jgi:hypothetical protein
LFRVRFSVGKFRSLSGIKRPKTLPARRIIPTAFFVKKVMQPKTLSVPPQGSLVFGDFIP